MLEDSTKTVYYQFALYFLLCYYALGTFNGWVFCQISVMKGGDRNEQERFSDFVFGHFNLPISIITIYSFDMKRKNT